MFGLTKILENLTNIPGLLDKRAERKDKKQLENDFKDLGYLKRDNEYYKDLKDWQKNEAARRRKIRGIVNNMSADQRTAWLRELGRQKRNHNANSTIPSLRQD